MASRRGKGVGGGHRLAIRGYTQLFKDLPRATRLKLEEAFVEAEDLSDFHTLDTPEKITRRVLSGFLESPVVEVINTILGGSVFWKRLNDPKIVFYEVQTDDVNVFPSPTSVTIKEPFFSLERINTSKFVRVRGVRPDGQVGNYSNTVEVKPFSTAPVAHTHNFYQRYLGSDPDLAFNVCYAGEPSPKFYTIFEHDFYPTRNVGGMSVYGFVSTRLKRFADSNVKPWDRLKFTVNGITRSEGYFCHWADNSVSSDNSPIFLNSEFYGEPVSFYSKGGYTAAFGPFGVPYLPTQQGDGYNDPTIMSSLDAGTEFYWTFVKDVKRPTQWDKSILSDVRTSERAFESLAAGVLAGETTNYMKAQGFNFEVPSNMSITGIQLAIKRRQNSYDINSLEPDLGNNRPLFPLIFHPGTIDAIVNGDIEEDSVFGKHVVHQEGLDATLASTQIGPGDIDLNNINPLGPWTVSTWFNLGGLPTSGTTFLYELGPLATAPDFSIFINLFNGNRLLTGMGRSSGAPNIRSQRYHTVIDTAGKWYNVIFVNENKPDEDDRTTIKTYLNGEFLEPDASVGPDFEDWDPVIAGQKKYIFTPSVLASDIAPLRMGQTALWNRALGESEAEKIAESFGRIDLTVNQGSYQAADNLLSYHLFLPLDPNIRDFEVRLIDSENNIRTDIENKALTQENWPLLADFFYVDIFYPGFSGGTSTGIPHDSVTGYGYQEYGGAFDLWGGEQQGDKPGGFYGFYSGLLSPQAINDPNFGFAIRAKSIEENFPGNAFIDHVKARVFWQDTSIEAQRRIRLKIKAEAATEFYLVREMYGGIFNSIEIGSVL